jgi:hypothetical protein
MNFTSWPRNAPLISTVLNAMRLSLSRLAQLERQKSIRFPAFYKAFLNM